MSNFLEFDVHFLIAIVYPDSAQAQAAEEAIRGFRSKNTFVQEDSCTVTRDVDGKLHLRQGTDLMTPALLSCTASGAVVGTVFGGPVLGLLIGVVAGVIMGRGYDYGIPDPFMRELAQAMVPGTATLFLRMVAPTFDQSVAALAAYGGTLLYTDLPRDVAESLTNALAEHDPTEADHRPR